jgi:hypothetical protein
MVHDRIQTAGLHMPTMEWHINERMNYCIYNCAHTSFHIYKKDWRNKRTLRRKRAIWNWLWNGEFRSRQGIERRQLQERVDEGDREAMARKRPKAPRIKKHWLQRTVMVSIVTRLWAGRPEKRGSITDMGNRFFCFHKAPTPAFGPNHLVCSQWLFTRH